MWSNAYREKYQMNDGWIKSVDKEKDLDMLMFKDLKFSKCPLAKNKTNLILVIINKGVSYKST